MAGTRNRPSTRKLPEFMKSLSPEQVAIVDSHLLTESSTDALIEMIQKGWGMLPNMNKGSLRRAIYRYKDRFILPKQAQVMARVTNDESVIKLAAAQSTIEQVLNPIQALEAVVDHQLKRVAKLKLVEDKMPTLMDSQTKNLTTLSDMLYKLAGLHLDVGLLRKVPQKVEMEVSKEQQAFFSNLRASKESTSVRLDILTLLESRGHLVVDGGR